MRLGKGIVGEVGCTAATTNNATFGVRFHQRWQAARNSSEADANSLSRSLTRTGGGVLKLV